MKKKLAIISTHPIQYNAPVFKLLQERNIIESKVFYTWGQEVLQEKYDPGFKRTVAWDIPLLEGYDYEFVKNVAADAGSHHFKGIDNPGLIEILKRWEPDAILVFGWSFKSHLKILRHFKGKTKIMFRGDSTLLDEAEGFSLQKIARHVFLKWVYSFVDMALYAGEANKAYFLKYGLKEAQLVFAPHAIDNQRFKMGMETNNSLPIPADNILFLFAGKFATKKDALLLMTAFINLQHPKAHLLLVGNGEQEETLKELAVAQPGLLRERIHFFSFKNQSAMPAVYQLCDVFVLPSKGPGETWGLAVNEAMAAGKAVLVSDKCGCASDLVSQGENGFVFKAGDGKDLENKMALLAEDKNRLTVMGKRSFEIVQGYDFENIAKAIESSLVKI